MYSPFNVFYTSNIAVTRTSGEYNDTTGAWETSDTEYFNIVASVQPTNPNEMQSLPEGRRIDDSLTLYTETELRSVTGGTNNPDKLTIYNDEYEVIKVYNWFNFKPKHYKIIVLRIAQGQGV